MQRCSRPIKRDIKLEDFWGKEGLDIYGGNRKRAFPCSDVCLFSQSCRLVYFSSTVSEQKRNNSLPPLSKIIGFMA